MIGATINKLLTVVFSTYLILWIQTFIGNGLKDDNEAKDIYIKIMIFSVLASSIIFPIVGRLCDSFEPRNILPFSFLIRCLSTVLFCMLNHPDSY